MVVQTKQAFVLATENIWQCRYQSDNFKWIILSAFIFIRKFTFIESEDEFIT
jgi:hypothetical protein